MLDTSRIRSDMDRMSMLQSDVARESDLTEATISRILNGKRLPGLPVLERMGRALHSDPRRWLVWVDD